jgi:DNA helicase-2/ATP-dependent DNA helicase PcrA
MIADLHIHSRFSRATSRNLSLPNLWLAARAKGLHLLGSGDITHPAWLDEMEEGLEADHNGAYRLKKDLRARLLPLLPPAAGEEETSFVLSGEISCIYKKNDRTRKVHCLLILPDFAAARRLNHTLGKLGNITSDGRPILGLDARDLLEISLEAHAQTIFIPAHIWTPWFSLFGSKSGFDHLEECFADLSGHITALETGLSSDPAMNWRLSQLDKYVLVSDSDAHSLDTLGREANLLDCEPGFPSLRAALSRPGHPYFRGTIEFFPDEGKYHLDGHRACGVCLTPPQSRELGGLCPQCGRPLTIGVLNRVEELADRPLGFRPLNPPRVESLTALSQVLSQILGKGPASKALRAWKDLLLRQAGSELFILRHWPLEEARRLGGELLAEGLARLRAGRVILHPGYDGQFGRVELFSAEEKDEIKGQGRLLSLGSPAPAPQRPKRTKGPEPAPAAEEAQPNSGLDPEQTEAICHQGSHLRISAGPGSGKTRVLVERINHLLGQGLAPASILGLTFTNKAAQELRARLANPQVQLTTFHRLGWRILGRPQVLAEEERLALIKSLAREQGFQDSPAALAQALSLDKQRPGPPEHPLSPLYARRLREAQALDVDDLVYQACRELHEGGAGPEFRHILVDEYQDVNPVQMEMLKLLLARAASHAPAWLTVIGDPRQAIYAFRGARRELFLEFERHFSPLRSEQLRRNYRSQAAIVQLAGQLLSAEENNLLPMRPPAVLPLAATLPDPPAEARWLTGQILALLGGLDSRQSDKFARPGEKEYAPKDIAVIYRLHQQGEIIHEALEQAMIPVQRAKDKELAELEDFNFQTQKVNLLTMHAAKGLEFPVVFVCGLENGLVPFDPPGGQTDQAEEARLLFVALTRAKERLFISRARRRFLFGRSLPGGDSPLWLALQGRCLQTTVPAAGPRRARQMGLFK